ncbi:uncharacterized protein LOC110007078 [Amborella trichopoda]|uniref:Uncharacterized protein n=1 Tax=Amborella trichopoda TaxID=13333 RepID=W1P920_AMBTC|nr:uncharacterized protein LOC110007078 [Amborella trichopoda]ERN04101.1 hypothetical protein AMTR_s00077p00022100 [Amborella trichopoda]|eukprot:XP_020521682.1 uncharacterized protein LOC110007078 [Amborella trichopoda]
MEIERTKLKRKPLVDCTNTLSRASSAIKESCSKPILANPKKFDSKTSGKNPNKYCPKTSGKNPKNDDSKTSVGNPRKHDSKTSGGNPRKHDSKTSEESPNKYETSTGSSDAASWKIQSFGHPTPCPRISTETDLPGCESIDQDVVPKCKSFKRKNGELLPASCPPIGGIARFWKKLGKQVCEAGPSKVQTDEPVQEKKKRWYSMPELLSRDFIEEQRAKFAEIDAFELEEEVASESE